MTISFTRTIPILRMFEPALPLYMQISRDAFILHLTEHHGDCTPGAKVFVEMAGVAELHAELTARNYNYMRPGLERAEWGATTLTVTDPCMNRIVFVERDPE